LGDKVSVQVVRVDAERRQIDLGLSDILEAVRREERPHAVRGRTRPKKEMRRSQRPGRRERLAQRKGRRR
jgi:ribosomal protein S1